MASNFVQSAFLRVVFPVGLIVACLLRPSVFSLWYGLLALAALLVPVPSIAMPGATKMLLLGAVVTTAATTVCQIVFQILTFSYLPLREQLGACNETESLFRLFGMQRLDGAVIANIFRIITPDPLALVVSVATYVVVCTLHQPRSPFPETTDEAQVQLNSHGKDEPRGLSPRARLLMRATEMFWVVLLCFCGVAYPSVISLVYFLIFMGILTYWSFYNTWKRTLARPLKLALMAYSAAHLILLYCCQFQLVQASLDFLYIRKDYVPLDVIPRVFGLAGLVFESCDDPSMLHLSRSTWPMYVNVALLLIFYYFSAIQLKWIDQEADLERRSIGVRHDDGSSIHEELLGDPEVFAERRGSGAEPVRRYDRGLSLGTVPVDSQEFSKLGQVLSLLVRHSYAFALITMMAWTVTYHSWFSFVFLILACLFWLLPNTRKACLYSSIFVLFYAELQLLAQYLYCLPLTEKELPIELKGEKGLLIQLGFYRTELPTPSCVPLIVKTLYAVPFWLTVRLFFRERHHKKQVTSQYGTFGSPPSLTSLEGAPRWLSKMLTKYWIYVCALVILLISIQNPVVAYTVVYMIFFAILITMVQASWLVTRRLLLLYWLVVATFSVCVIVCVYMYQFHEIPEWWANTTGFSPEVTKSLGLVQYTPSKLVANIGTPMAYLVVVVLQLKFFHNGFMELTDMETRSKYDYPATGIRRYEVHDTPAGTRVAIEDRRPTLLRKLWDAFWEYQKKAVDVLWRLLEIHWPKMIALASLLLAVYEPVAVHFPIVIIVSLMLVFRYFHLFLSIIITLWVSAIIVAKMLFQMDFVPPQFTNGSCEFIYDSNDTSINRTIADWAGFAKIGSGEFIGHYVMGHIFVLTVLGLQGVIILRQRYRRLVDGASIPAQGIIFPDITRNEADEGLLECLKYFANYFFYKFGVEMTFIMTTVTVAIRMDAVAVLYTVILLCLLPFRRKTLSYLWPIYVTILAILLPLQYASCIGLPSFFCLDYPWSRWARDLSIWLYLPSYDYNAIPVSPNPKFLIADFFQLLFACCQMYMFRSEVHTESDGGSNAEIVHPTYGYMINNPVDDFINDKSYLDWFKIFLFQYFHWITLLIVLIGGVSAVSLFALGYLLFSFILLWKGNEIFVNMRAVRRLWMGLLFFTTIIILMKASLQVVGCVLSKAMEECSLCWLMQLFSISCLRPKSSDSVTTLTGDSSAGDAGKKPGEHGGTESHEGCFVDPDYAHIRYDAVIFAFVILQIRFFATYYFDHVRKEFGAQRELASYGASLINRLMKREILQQMDSEEAQLEEVRQKMVKIKETQLKTGTSPAETYAKAKRCGSYHMFDYDEQPKIDEDPSKGVAPEVDPNAGKDLGPDPLQIVSEAVDQDFYLDKDSKPVSDHCKDDEEECEEEQSKIGLLSKLFGIFGFVLNLLKSTLKLMTKWFNRLSRNYRFIAAALDKEKEKMKAGWANREPIVHQACIENVEASHVESTLTDSRSRREKPSRGAATDDEIKVLTEQAEEYSRNKNTFTRCLKSLFYLTTSRTDILCYILMVVNHMKYASLLSLPFPLMAFFWGTLYAPRPPKVFWITIVTYAEALVVLKFLFQFDFYHWQHQPFTENPFWPPRIIGIEKSANYAIWDIVLLMALFYHRYLLRSMGLWRDVDNEIVSELTSETSRPSLEEQLATETKGAVTDSLELQEVVNLNGGENVENATDKTNGVAVPVDEDGAHKSKITRYGGYCSYCSEFFKSLLHPNRWYLQDLYTYMFACDFVCFFILVFGYASFGTSQGASESVINAIKENKVPLPFILMLLAQFSLIVVDRALYLRHSQLGRVIFHYVLIVTVHIWIFFALPSITERSVKVNTPAKVWYFIKSLYFLFSAWQIKSGYPTRTLGNFLTKSFNMVNMICFKIFINVPFLFELRTLMDWIWTDTSMTLFDWFKMENIYAYAYSLKCTRKMEEDYPFPIGQKRGFIIKYGMGFGLLLLIVLILWLPLLLFSLLNAIGQYNPPARATLRVQIEGFPPFYETVAQEKFLRMYTDDEYKGFLEKFKDSKAVQTFMADYSARDVFLADFSKDSQNQWIASPPASQQLGDVLTGSKNVSLMFYYELVRLPRGEEDPVTLMNQVMRPLDMKIRNELKDILVAPTSDKTVLIPSVFFPYVEVPPSGMAKDSSSIIQGLHAAEFVEPPGGFLADIRLSKKTKGTIVWWHLEMKADEWAYPFPHQSPSDVLMTLFVSKVFPSVLDAVTSKGIIGIYIAVVYVCGRVIRGVITGSLSEIMWDEVPNINYVYQLCQDIFLVREACDFVLEIELFAKLLFLFRSPATMIEWTRQKQD